MEGEERGRKERKREGKAKARSKRRERRRLVDWGFPHDEPQLTFFIFEIFTIKHLKFYTLILRKF